MSDLDARTAQLAAERAQWNALDEADFYPAPRYREAGHITCPYSGCGYTAVEAAVNDHRSAAHRDEPQAGSNFRR